MAYLAQSALDVVTGGCNLSGIVQSWADVMVRLNELVNWNSTTERNQYCINVLFAEACGRLTGLDFGPAGVDQWFKAFSECQRLVKGG